MLLCNETAALTMLWLVPVSVTSIIPAIARTNMTAAIANPVKSCSGGQIVVAAMTVTTIVARAIDENCEKTVERRVIAMSTLGSALVPSRVLPSLEGESGEEAASALLGAALWRPLRAARWKEREAVAVRSASAA